MRLPRTHDIAEAIRTANKLEHVAIGTDQGLSCQLACAVRRNRSQWTVIFRDFLLAQVAIDAAAGGIENCPGARTPHGFNGIVGQAGALPEVDVWFYGRASDVRIGCEMNDDIVALHGRDESTEVFHIATNDVKSRIVDVLFVVPLT